MSKLSGEIELILDRSNRARGGPGKSGSRASSTGHQGEAIREQVGMTQTAFAAEFGISLSTLRHWERDDRTPKGPARVLLHVAARESQAVLRALGKAS